LFLLRFFGFKDAERDSPKNNHNSNYTEGDQNSSHSVIRWPFWTYVSDLGALGCIGADCDFNRVV